jgi:hypothetical protein
MVDSRGIPARYGGSETAIEEIGERLVQRGHEVVAYWRRRIDLALLGRWNPLGDNLAVEQPWRDPHVRFFNPGSLRRMLTSVGFHPVIVGGHGGSLVRDVPWIGRKLWRGKSSRLYRTAERAAPSLLAYRLHAVAFKPTSGK